MSEEMKMKYFIIWYRATVDGKDFQGDFTCKTEIYPNRKQIKDFLLKDKNIVLSGIVFINQVTKEECEAYKE